MNYSTAIQSKKKQSVYAAIIIVLLVLCVSTAAVMLYLRDSNEIVSEIENIKNEATISQSLVQLEPDSISEFSGNDYVVLNDNVPLFTETDIDLINGEYYSPLDSLGRCGVVYAQIDQTMMPTAEREAIGMIKPSGWQTIKYPDVISDLYLYNRCHLIAYALTGQNANEQNLITGTRYMNISGMLPFENLVIDYLEETNNHVLYRVTPFFKGNELIARGVEMEALSVEDGGEGLCFHVFVYNYQPGIEIDYMTGDSRLAE